MPFSVLSGLAASTDCSVMTDSDAVLCHIATILGYADHEDVP